MCLITYLPPGVMPVQEHLENGARLNPDGHGFALGTTWAHKGLDPAWMIRMFTRLREENPGVPALFHSRLGTGTSTPTVDNCHPCHSGDLIIAHNGFLFPASNGKSDTRVFAEEILPRYDLDNEQHRQILEQRLGPHNKLVILKPDGHADILNPQHGITLPDGTWHSNISYTGEMHVNPGECFTCGGPPDVQVSARSSVCQDCYTAVTARRELLMEDIPR
jgi:hypothetical protein